MEITITNKIITLKNLAQGTTEKLLQLTTCQDKSKLYQLKRMARNSFYKNSPAYNKLKEQSKITLIEKTNQPHTFTMASGLKSILDTLELPYSDFRNDTGTTIPLPWNKKPNDLRPYQQESLEIALKNYRGIVNLATGLGKSLIIAHLIKNLRKKALVIAPTQSVAQQLFDQLQEAFGRNKVSFYGSGKKKINFITVGIAASITKHTEDFKDADLGVVIFDEAHYLGADTFYSISKNLGHVGRIYGFTATSFRSDGKDLLIQAACGDILIERDVVWGVQNKFLAEPVFLVREVNSFGADFKDDKLKSYKQHVLNNKVLKDRILKDIQVFISKGKSVLCLVDEISHGQELSTQLGVPFATGEDKNSQSYLDNLNAGKIPALIATDGKMGVGSNTKNVDVLVLANFVAAKGPTLQAIGRGLRLVPGKTSCVILDYCPLGSTMLVRHCQQRISYYKEITNKIKIIKLFEEENNK